MAPLTMIHRTTLMLNGSRKSVNVSAAEHVAYVILSTLAVFSCTFNFNLESPYADKATTTKLPT
jgi:hypothetical protein